MTTRRRRLGQFKSVAEREAVVYSYINERVNQNLPPLTVDDVFERREAFCFLQKCLDRNPKNPTAHHGIAPLIQMQGDIKRAVKHYQCAITYNPMDLDAMNDLALILFKSHDQKKALELLTRVLEVNPNHILGNKNIAAVYAATGKYNEALRHSEKAAQLNPLDPMIHRNIAKLRHTMGSSLEAVKSNRIAIRLGPGIHAMSEKGDYNAYRHLALQLVATGQRESGYAQEHYDAYRALAGKRHILSLSERTRELLEKTRTKV